MTGTNSAQNKLHVGPNMTPMVDVVMCILIFFMLGSSFLLPEWNFKQPPGPLGIISDTRGTGLPAVRCVIRITRENGETWIRAFDSKPLKFQPPGDPALNAPLENLFVAKGKVLSPNVQVLIAPQGGVPYQDIISIYEYCLKAQLRQVGFAPAS